MAEEYPVKLDQWACTFGITFWSLSIDTTRENGSRGGMKLFIDIQARQEGICIAGNYWISWEDLEKAKAYAKNSPVSILSQREATQAGDGD